MRQSTSSSDSSCCIVSESDEWNTIRVGSVWKEGSVSWHPRWAEMSEEEEDNASDDASRNILNYHLIPQKTFSLAEQSPKRLDAQLKERPKPVPRNKKARGHDTKHQCQFVVGIEEESRFHVVRRIIGVGGANVKFIAHQAGLDTRLRLRGHGSKFLEGPHYQEAPEPLMLCVSARNRTAYDIATGLVREQLERVYEEYDAFRESNGKHPLRLQVRMHDGPRAGSR